MSTARMYELWQRQQEQERQRLQRQQEQERRHRPLQPATTRRPSGLLVVGLAATGNLVIGASGEAAAINPRVIKSDPDGIRFTWEHGRTIGRVTHTRATETEYLVWGVIDEPGFQLPASCGLSIGANSFSRPHHTRAGVWWETTLAMVHEVALTPRPADRKTWCRLVTAGEWFPG